MQNAATTVPLEAGQEAWSGVDKCKFGTYQIVGFEGNILVFSESILCHVACGMSDESCNRVMNM